MQLIIFLVTLLHSLTTLFLKIAMLIKKVFYLFCSHPIDEPLAIEVKTTVKDKLKLVAGMLGTSLVCRYIGTPTLTCTSR